MTPQSLVDPARIAAMINKAALTPWGSFVEVGVYKGGTAWHLYELAQIAGRSCFFYDTFEGIPYRDEIDHHKLKDFSNVDYESIKKMFPKAQVIKGIFPKSASISHAFDHVAFAHIDCDQYRSIRESCIYLIPRMAPGGVMWFDDSPGLAGAEKAVTELFGDRLQLSNDRHFVVF